MIQWLRIFLDNTFQLTNRNTSIKTEVIGAFTTFFTMAYIAVVNPVILSQAGMDFSDIFLATCIVTAIGSLLFAWLSNYPIVIAPAMGINTYFTYTIVILNDFSWQTALALSFVAALLILITAFTNIRRKIIDAIPHALHIAIIAGIGFFILIIGLNNLNMFDQARLIHPGEWQAVPIMLALSGLGLIILFNKIRLAGSMLWSIVIITIISYFLQEITWLGVWSMPHGFDETFFALNFKNIFDLDALIIILSLAFVMLFDTTGTLLALVHQMQGINQPMKAGDYAKSLKAESISSLAGGLLGTSGTTPYIESAAGIKAGARTGLTSIIVALLFLLLLFFNPLVQSIPIHAVVPVLIYVGLLMIKTITQINWRDIQTSIPGLVMIVTIPLTFSIADGIGWGFISFIVINLITRNLQIIKPAVYVIGAIFTIHFIHLLWFS